MFYVRGVPVPQGSVTAHAHKRKDGTTYASVHYAVGSPLHRWRTDIALAARAEWGDEMTYHPVQMRTVFYMPRPMRHWTLERTLRPAYVEVEHSSRPDLDKLIRGVLDALTDVIYEDDSQVSVIYASKIYVPEWAHPAGVQVSIDALP